ncbi:uncharacterized protein LOC141647140 isoform X2 [Silene latifolia]|uniref:uncharacterized protein LOC141647140 isoform X2 n=1 Tax=Silene latifolia TaxID=37657 RepID=UPI003D76FA31
MSKVPDKQSRDQPLDFEGFLTDLQNWDSSLKDKGQVSKPQVIGKGKSISSAFMTEDSTVDAVTEKDLGNEYYKQKKFNDAIDCYSRSIALSPTAVAYANRAMAYLKIKRFQEAEDDCTEALNLDDRYIKAYSRRATARKELRKLRDSLEDVEFALRLEPQNEDLKKQRAEVKSLLEKAILAKAAGSAKRPPQVVKEVEQEKDKHSSTVPAVSKKAGVDVLSSTKQVSSKESFMFGDTTTKNTTLENKTRQQINGLDKAAPNSSYVKNNKACKEFDMSVQELASRAASRARAEAAKNIVTPKTAYQFEVSWRGFSGDRSLQSRLLKVTPPDALPDIFKNALTSPLLVDMIKCLSSLFTDDTELVVKYLEKLTKVPRFDMIIMCLPSADKADVHRIWNEVFLSKATPIEFAELLSELHRKYCPQLMNSY